MSSSVIKKIVLIGPESTGKSSLSAALARHYNTAWAPEYAREYLMQLDREYHQDDLCRIALGQLHTEDQAAARATRYLICDTDLYVLKVWSEHKYGSCAYRILEEIAQRHYDAYLLTDIDIPWTYDPLREHPEPELRAYFQQVYSDIVQNTGRPWTALRGNLEACLQDAVRFIDTTLAS